MHPIQPSHFPRPKGYANGMVVQGRLLFVAGQIGWETDGSFASNDFVVQFGKALQNVIDVVRAAGAGPEHIASMTIYATELEPYRSRQSEIGAVWRATMGRNYPAMAMVGVQIGRAHV